MVDVIPSLIDKQDSFEIVRDQIALILATEAANQKALAIAVGKPEPDLFDFRVFTERSNPWEQELNRPDQLKAGTPIVNVWYSNGDFEQGSSSVVTRQKQTGTFNIDVYGFGISKDDGNGGHFPGDEEAAFAAQRGVRLVRNILMAGINTYLQLRGKPINVWSRFIRSIEIFQPKMDSQVVQKVVAARIQLDVGFSEVAPQVAGQTLELISVDIERASDGQVLAEADYTIGA